MNGSHGFPTLPVWSLRDRNSLLFSTGQQRLAQGSREFTECMDGERIFLLVIEPVYIQLNWYALKTYENVHIISKPSHVLVPHFKFTSLMSLCIGACFPLASRVTIIIRYSNSWWLMHSTRPIPTDGPKYNRIKNNFFLRQYFCLG